MVHHHKHVILLSLLCISLFSLAMDNENIEKRLKNVPLKSFKMISEEERETFTERLYESLSNRFAQPKETFEYAINFEQEGINKLEQIYELAPKRARLIVKHLRDKNLYGNGSYRSSFFIGVTGSGKSALAKAIAYKMQQKAQWSNQFISSTEFLKQNKNLTTIYFNEILDKVTKLSTPHLLIIDDLNLLLDHSDNDLYDTSALSQSLWNFLDQQNNRHNFFFIGIMQSAEKLPIQLKDRMLGKIIFFDYITDQNMKVKIFKNILKNKNLQLHEDINDNYLNEQLNRLPTLSARNIENIMFGISKVYRRELPKKEQIVFEKKHIDQAITECLILREKIKYYKINETNEERLLK